MAVTEAFNEQYTEGLIDQPVSFLQHPSNGGREFAVSGDMLLIVKESIVINDRELARVVLDQRVDAAVSGRCMRSDSPTALTRRNGCEGAA